MAQKAVPSETTVQTKYRPPAKREGFNLTGTEALLGAAAAGAYLLFGLRSSSSSSTTTTTTATPSTSSSTTTTPEAPALAAPEAPTLLEQIGRTAGSVVVECNPVAGATQYTWYDEATNLQLTSSPTNVARISNLQANHTYEVYVVASNSAGSSAPSQPLMVGTNLTNSPEVTPPSTALPSVTTTVIVELLTGTAPQGTGGSTKTPPKKGKVTLLKKTDHYLYFDAATCLYHFEVIGHYSDGTTRDLGTITKAKAGCKPPAKKAASPKVTLKYSYAHYLSFDAKTCLYTFQKMGVYSDGTTRAIGQPYTEQKAGCTPTIFTAPSKGNVSTVVKTESSLLGKALNQLKAPTEAPYNLTHTSPLGTSAGAVRIQLSWAPIAGATHYVVSLASGRVLTTVPSNALLNGQVVANVYLQPNLPYKIAVQACNADGCGPKSYFDNGQNLTFGPYPGSQKGTSTTQGTPAAGLSQKTVSGTPSNTQGGNLGQAKSLVPTLVATTVAYHYFDATTCLYHYTVTGHYSNGTSKVIGSRTEPKPGCTPAAQKAATVFHSTAPSSVTSVVHAESTALPHTATTTQAAQSTTQSHPAAKATAPRLVSTYDHYHYFDAATCLFHFQRIGVYSDGTHRVLSTYTKLKAGCHPAATTSSGNLRFVSS